MTASHVALDHALFAAFLLDTIVGWLWYWPRCFRAAKAGVPGARSRIYRIIEAEEWGLTACVIAVWIAYGRPWQALRLGIGSPLRLGIGLAFAALVIWLLRAQRKAIFARPESLARLRKKFDYADALMPHTPGERRGFQFVSISAGICEELFFRGFLMWYIAVWTGPVLAVVLSSVLFGFGHIYLDIREVPRTGILGVVFALIVLAAGSLWPAMIIHAAVDLNSGEIGYRALTGDRGSGPEPPESPVPATV